MTDEEVRLIVRETVHETLKVLAIDVEEPFEVQKDMVFVRNWRTTTEAVSRGGVLTVALGIVAGICGLIWAAWKGSA